MKNGRMILRFVAPTILILGLILPAVAAGASLASVSLLTTDRNSAVSSTPALNTSFGQTTPVCTADIERTVVIETDRTAVALSRIRDMQGDITAWMAEPYSAEPILASESKASEGQTAGDPIRDLVSTSGTIVSGAIIGWLESDYVFCFDAHTSVSSNIEAWWSINRCSPPVRGWFYGYSKPTVVAHAPGITHISEISDASAFSYDDWYAGPVSVGEFVLFHNTTTGYYAAFRVDSIYGIEPCAHNSYLDVTWYLQTDGSPSFAGAVEECATISPATLQYDLASPANQTTSITWNSATSIVSITDSASTLVPNTHYTVVGNTLTILTAYLESKLTAAGQSVMLTINFDVCSSTLTITAIDTSLPNEPPVASILSLGGQPKIMYPNVQYTVAAAYHDPDGMEDLKYCYLRLNHPTKPLTLMWNRATDEFWTWAGEEGANYVTVTGYTVPMHPTGYDITWQFTLNDTWPEVEDAIDFGLFAMDNQGAVSGWDYDDTKASFRLTVGIVISPQEATVAVGDSMSYSAIATDIHGATSDVTAETVFTIEIGAGGTWMGSTYTSEIAGEWTVTGNYKGLEETAALAVEQRFQAPYKYSSEYGWDESFLIGDADHSTAVDRDAGTGGIQARAISGLGGSGQALARFQLGDSWVSNQAGPTDIAARFNISDGMIAWSEISIFGISGQVFCGITLEALLTVYDATESREVFREKVSIYDRPPEWRIISRPDADSVRYEDAEYVVQGILDLKEGHHYTWEFTAQVYTWVISAGPIAYAVANGFASIELTDVVIGPPTPAPKYEPVTSEFMHVLLASPANILVIDPEGRRTGFDSMAQEEVNEIPNAWYSGQGTSPQLVDIPDLVPGDYTFLISGTSIGEYILSVLKGNLSDEDCLELSTFQSVAIPTSFGTIHQYHIDWAALARGEDGVTVSVDCDGDGEFERTFTTGSELTSDQFILHTETFIDFDPDVLNLRARGRQVTVYIELPEGFDVNEIDVSSIRLNGTVPALSWATAIGDYNDNGIPDLMVKFDGAAVRALLTPGSQVITITGQVAGITFEGTDTIRVTDPTWYSLDISSTTGGSVTVPGEGTYSCKGGTAVSLVATPDPGYYFANWTGDVGTIANVNAASTTITMNADYSITANFEEEPVHFPDPNLEAAIREAIGKPAGDIYASELEGLTQLSAPGRDIVDLTGLEYCIDLTYLNLNSNQISKISPVEGLTNLTYLNLENNQISDIAPVEGLTSLTTLYLPWNQISDIAPVEGLTNLRHLSLSYNQISDISPLEGLTDLRHLSLSNNQISDISPLEGLTDLRHLSLFNNQISDISPLEGLTKLTRLYLSSNGIAEITALEGLTDLAILFLSSNQISDISPLEGLTSLTSLSLERNQISDISPLTNLTELSSLQIPVNQISDISPLEGLTSLTSLSLERNQISDISPLEGLTSLRSLYLSSNQISDISPLEGLTSLTTLYLSSNQISDISPLEGLTSLTTLYFSSNQVSDTSALAGLTSLTTLYLQSNEISDIKPLVDNTGLGHGDQIDLRWNPLSEQSINEHVPELQARGVNVWY